MAAHEEKENDNCVSEVLSKLSERKMAIPGLFVIVVEIIVVIVFAGILHLSPYESDYTLISAAPGKTHNLDTDAGGRNIFATLIYDGRTSLLVRILSTLISSMSWVCRSGRSKAILRQEKGHHHAESGNFHVLSFHHFNHPVGDCD